MPPASELVERTRDARHGCKLGVAEAADIWIGVRNDSEKPGSDGALVGVTGACVAANVPGTGTRGASDDEAERQRWTRAVVRRLPD